MPNQSSPLPGDLLQNHDQDVSHNNIKSTVAASRGIFCAERPLADISGVTAQSNRMRKKCRGALPLLNRTSLERLERR
jgi:hypothetical protein